MDIRGPAQRPVRGLSASGFQDSGLQGSCLLLIVCHNPAVITLALLPQCRYYTYVPNYVPIDPWRGCFRTLLCDIPHLGNKDSYRGGGERGTPIGQCPICRRWCRPRMAHSQGSAAFAARPRECRHDRGRGRP